MDVAAIIPAAGDSRRFGGRTNKLFIALNGQPLLVRTLQALQASPAIRWIILVVRSEERAQAAALLKRHRLTKAQPPCVGGASRAESVANGVAALPRAARWVLVHDGARPCVSQRLIEEAVRAARRYGAVACGLPASVTVKAVDAQAEVRLTLDRERLWFVQTPQVFRRDWLIQALERAAHRLDQFPDDAALIESAGFRVRMIPGDPLNLKVTTQDDLLLAEAILAARNGRGEVKIQKAKVKTTSQKSKVRTTAVDGFGFEF